MKPHHLHQRRPEEGDTTWMTDAACAGMDTNLFYPERGEDNAQAVAVCRDCPVREQCLDHAVRNGETYGVWGGLSGKQRRRLRRDRRAA